MKKLARIERESRGCTRILVRKYFTLIELLVVLSIIALLLGFLVPALNTVKNQLKNLTCVDNLDEIGTGLMSYSTDNTGYLPSTNKNDKVSDLTVTYDYWHTALAYGGYVGAPDTQQSGTINGGIPEEGILWDCPAEEWIRPYNETSGSWCGTNYGINVYLAGFVTANVTKIIPPKRVYAIPTPSMAIFTGDTGTLNQAGYKLQVSTKTVPFRSRHDGLKSNILHADGHVEAFEQLDLEDFWWERDERYYCTK